MPYIPTEPVESSNLERVGYDRKTSTLRIVFHGNRTYDYPMVPEQEYRKLLEAESKGKFFNTRIKPMYGHRTPRSEELEAPPTVPHTHTAEADEGPIPYDHEHEGGGETHDHAEAPPEVADSCAHEHREATVDGSIVVCADCGTGLADEPVEVIAVPPALPRTPTSEIDYAAIPDASHLFADRDGLLDVPCRCCGLPLRVPPEDACDLCADCYQSKGGDTDDPCRALHNWKPIGEHEHPQLTSEPDD